MANTTTVPLRSANPNDINVLLSEEKCIRTEIGLDSRHKVWLEKQLAANLEQQSILAPTLPHPIEWYKFRN